MANWTEAQKVQIRKYLGFPALFKQFEPRLENAINSIRAIADGGVLPTDDTQLSLISVLSALADIDAKITALYCQFAIEMVSNPEVKLNAIKAAFFLKSEGRRLISQLCIPLGTRPIRDYYSPIPQGTYTAGQSLFWTELD